MTQAQGRNPWHGELYVDFIYPPIPHRGFDYVAYRDPEGLHAYGETEEEARQAFLEEEWERLHEHDH